MNASDAEPTEEELKLKRETKKTKVLQEILATEKAYGKMHFKKLTNSENTLHFKLSLPKANQARQHIVKRRT
jgi:hypothetical protein